MRTPDPTVSGGVFTDAQPEFTYRLAGRRRRHAAAVHAPQRRGPGRVGARGAAAGASGTRESPRLTGEAQPRPPRGRRPHAGSISGIETRSFRSSPTIESMAEVSYRSGQTGLTAFLQALQSAREVRLRATDVGLEYQTRAGRSRARAWRTHPMRHVMASLCALFGRPAPALACHEAPPDETVTETAVAVSVEPARTGTSARSSPRPASSTAAPGAELIVTAPEAARIAELPKAEGDRVRAGESARPLRYPVAHRWRRVGRAGDRAGEGARRQRERGRGTARRAGRARRRRAQGSRGRRARAARSRSPRSRQAQSAARRGAGAGRRAPSCARHLPASIAKRWHNPGDLVEPGSGDPILRVIDPVASRDRRRRAGRRPSPRIAGGRSRAHRSIPAAVNRSRRR